MITIVIDDNISLNLKKRQQSLMYSVTNTRLLLAEARFGNTKQNYNHSIDLKQM